MPNFESIKLPPTIVKAWVSPNALLEFYRYTPQQSEKLPAHCHGEYQFCLGVNYPSEYYYRKSVHFMPVGSLNIIHPGEMHSGTGRDVGDRQSQATFRMMYINPKVLRQVLDGAFEQKTDLPFFSNSIIVDSSLSSSFLKFHQASQCNAPQLEQDERLQLWLTVLMQKYANNSLTLKSLGQERASVRRARDYLHNHYAENVTLQHLAHIANLSPSYVSRVFKAEVGVSLPHYQNQIRINRARKLLLKGMSTKQAAAETGFVDQSHLTHYFKRFVQATPGNYG